MSFSYDQIKLEQESGTHWTSYSDLFMALSMIFLLLYVTSSLRNGTEQIQRHIQVSEQNQEISQLKNQLAVYDTLKEDYLQTSTASSDKKVYASLMNKIDLLKDETEEKKKEFAQKYAAQKQKEADLNNYQKVVKNLITANMLSQSKLQKRNDIIKDQKNNLWKKIQTIRKNEKAIKSKDSLLAQKEKILGQKHQQIVALNTNIQKKEEALAVNQAKIKEIKWEEEKKISALRKDLEAKRISESNLEKELKKVQQQSTQKISKLDAQNQNISKEMSQVLVQLEHTSSNLNRARDLVIKEKTEKNKVKDQLKKTQTTFETKISQLQSAHDAQVLKSTLDFYENQKKLQLTELQKAEQEKKFNQHISQLNNKKDKEVAQLRQELDQNTKKVKNLSRERDQVSAKNAALAKDLTAVQHKANAKRQLAKRIKDNFKKHGINAQVNPNTGDVVLNFGQEYFDTDSARLKVGMKETLNNFVPVYAKSLFEDSKVARKLSFVEIVGFASPTYLGAIVDPKSLDPKDRKAVNYNLDLSYYRARSIFKYIFDVNKLQYQNQKQLLSVVKVTGRSFLAEKFPSAKLRKGMSKDTFCNKYNCDKAQRVIMKFDLKD